MQSPSVPVLGPPDGSASDGTAAKRSSRRLHVLVRSPLCGTGASERISAGDDRPQPRRKPDDRAAVPLDHPYRTFADIGTAQGDLAVQIAAHNTHLQGFGFDLPEIAPIFEEYAQESGVADRLRFHPGDFFKDPFPKVDVITMGHILHDWNLETKQMLIRKAYEALPEGGALIVYEAIIDDDRRKNAFGLLMSLNMLIETHDGFDYTGADCSGWMKDAGFRETRVEALVGPDSMVIGIK